MSIVGFCCKTAAKDPGVNALVILPMALWGRENHSVYQWNGNLRLYKAGRHWAFVPLEEKDTLFGSLQLNPKEATT